MAKRSRKPAADPGSTPSGKAGTGPVTGSAPTPQTPYPPNTRIFQIFHDEETRRKLDPGFEPLDNSASPRPDWREYWPIRNYLLSNELDDTSWYGFLSPRFRESAGLLSGQIHELLQRVGAHCDVLVVAHDLDQLAYFRNPFERGELSYPNLIDESKKAFREIGVDFDIDAYVAHSENWAFTNYVIARPAFWRQWLQLANRFFDYAEDPRRGLSATMAGGGSGRAPMKAYIQAQLASVLVAGGRYRIAAVGWDDRRVRISPLFAEGKRTVRLLGSCDLFKQEFCANRGAAYLDLYRRVRAAVPIGKFTAVMSGIAFVTTSKGRLHHIQETLPRIVAERPDQVVVVNYSCPQGTGDWVAANHPGVRVVRVEGDPGFCLPLARNAGSKAVRTDWICFIDADVRIEPGFVNWMRHNLDPQCFYRAAPIDGVRDLETYGTFICTRAAFEQIGGFDETFRGWGGEDQDIFMRLADAGFQEKPYPSEFVSAIPHPEEERTAFHPVKSKLLQMSINKSYLTLKGDLTKILGATPPPGMRLQLMNRLREQFTRWAEDPDSIPHVAQNFQSDQELVAFPGYALVKQLAMTVTRIDAASLSKPGAKLGWNAEGPASIAVVTTCKGRLEHLRQSLPRLLEQSGADEVVVVNYGCPQGAGDWVERHHPQVKVVRVADDPGFNIARARNLGAAASRADWLLFIDADTLVGPGLFDWLRTILRDPAVFYRVGAAVRQESWDLSGIACLSRQAYDAVGGYDEAFIAYGVEDLDLIQSLEFAAYSEEELPAMFLEAIPHAHQLRTAHHAVKNMWVSIRAGFYYMALKQALVKLDGKPLPLDMRRALMREALSQSRNWTAERESPGIRVRLSGDPHAGGTGKDRFRIRQELVVTLEPDPVADAGAGKSAPAARRPARAAKKRVAMFHVGRCGSQLLDDMLSQHPDVSWDGELYEKLFEAAEKHLGPLKLGDPRCPIEPLSAVSNSMRSVTGQDDRLYGLEVKFFHLAQGRMDLEAYLDGLRKLGFDGWIVLRRRNLLRAITSNAIGRQVKRYHAREGKPAYPKTSIHLDPKHVLIDRQDRSLLEFLDNYTANHRRLDALLASSDKLDLSYEADIEQDPYVAYDKLVDYLGLAPAPRPAVHLRRTNPYPLNEIISNFDAIRDYLRGTPYAWMAEE